LFTLTVQNDFWTHYIHKDFIVDGFSHDILEKIKKRQERLLTSNPTGEDPRILIIFDDIASEKELRYDQTLRRFFYNGRHLQASTLVTSQWLTSLNPGCRENCDYIAIFGMNNHKEIENIWLEYGNGIPFKIFLFLVRRYASDTSCLIIYTHGTTPFERFFQYRAQDPGKFRLGCREAWVDRVSRYANPLPEDSKKKYKS
jgi:hypothetical protein